MLLMELISVSITKIRSQAPLSAARLEEIERKKARPKKSTDTQGIRRGSPLPDHGGLIFYLFIFIFIAKFAMIRGRCRDVQALQEVAAVDEIPLLQSRLPVRCVPRQGGRSPSAGTSAIDGSVRRDVDD